MKNNLNPNFQKYFALDYIFESRQDIKFDIFDDDGNGEVDFKEFIQVKIKIFLKFRFRDPQR